MHDAYRALFDELYPCDALPQRELKITLHFERARAVAAREGAPLESAVRAEYERASKAVAGRRVPLDPRTTVFACDSGLGGVARWLRLSGYDARFWTFIDDDDLIEETQKLGAILLTTDSLLMERGLLRDGVIPGLWVPPTLKREGQRRWVFREFSLVAGEARCGDCGGELMLVPKETVREQIPERTYVWLDDYWRCERCRKIYWQGTHWSRIRRTLDAE